MQSGDCSNWASTAQHRPGSAHCGQTSPEVPELGRVQEPAQDEEFLSAGYTSTPLIRDPSKTMVKS